MAEAVNQIIIANTDDVVQLLNESLLIARNGEWVTQSLNRQNPAHEFTLQRFVVVYFAEAADDLILRASPDGGSTYPVERTITLDAVDNGIATAWFDLTGRDLRVMIRLSETANLVRVTHYSATLKDRGPYALAR